MDAAAADDDALVIPIPHLSDELKMVQTSILCNLIYQWGYRIIYVYNIYLLVIETGLKNNGKWIFYKILTKKLHSN